MEESDWKEADQDFDERSACKVRGIECRPFVIRKDRPWFAWFLLSRVAPVVCRRGAAPPGVVHFVLESDLGR